MQYGEFSEAFASTVYADSENNTIHQPSEGH